ncbi:hypothetical protein pb186bvf_001580 [Paramecium bursaria]
MMKQQSSIKAIHILHLEQAVNRVSNYFKPQTYRDILKSKKVPFRKQSLMEQIQTSRSCLLKSFNNQRKKKTTQISCFETRIDQLKKEIEQTRKQQIIRKPTMSSSPIKERQLIIEPSKQTIEKAKIKPVFVKHIFLQNIFDKKIEDPPQSAPNTPDQKQIKIRMPHLRSVSQSQVARIVRRNSPKQQEFCGWDIKDEDDYFRLG